jgi:hypothetical protein
LLCPTNFEQWRALKAKVSILNGLNNITGAIARSPIDGGGQHESLLLLTLLIDATGKEELFAVYSDAEPQFFSSISQLVILAQFAKRTMSIRTQPHPNSPPKITQIFIPVPE